MLTTLTLVSIFSEIFAAGVFFPGSVVFLRRFIETRKKENLFFGLLLLSLFLYVAATIASQMMFNMGRPLPELISIHKFSHIQLLLASFFLWFFIAEKFAWSAARWISWLFVFGFAFSVYRILISTTNLIYREGVVEPLVYFSQPTPAKFIFALLWLVLVLASLLRARRSSGGERSLALLTSYCAILFLAALYAINLYVNLAEHYFLLVSWILFSISGLGLLLAELVPPDSALALRPLSFFRTRILFKLVLIFVLLIIILFEVTTLATLNLSRGLLSSAILQNYSKAAENLAAEINSYPSQPPFDYLQSLVAKAREGEKAVAFVIDQQGYLLAHPDRVRALSHEDLSAQEAVKKILSGKSGAGEFRDPLEGKMAGAYALISRWGWGVVVQEPTSSAYFELRRLETNSLLFVISGIILTVLVGIFFARSIERPIHDLMVGTEVVAEGDLNYQIKVTAQDEIGKLALAFNQMTKELRDSQERAVLSEKLASLGTMAAGMAHEIKNPLVSLRTFSQLIESRWEDEEFRKKFISIVPTEIERINRIAESLLKFGKPMKSESSRVNINSLLEEVLLLLESECKKSGIEIAKNLVPLPEIIGDPGLLSQAFVNVVLNAIQAMPSGGHLIVKTDRGEMVRLPAKSRQGVRRGEETVWGEGKEMGQPTPVVFVEVSDTGEGIPEENIKSLFDPFFSTKAKGTGMGLPITLRIIEEHGGTIKVRSKAGQGTTFIITLPLKS